MISQQFAQQDSLIHSLDPRVKIVVASLLIIITAVSKKLEVLELVLMLSCLLVVLAKLPIKQVINRLLVVNTFLVLIWIFIPFTYPGEISGQVGWLTFSKAGIMYAIRITLRSNAIMLLIISLLATTRFNSLIRATKYFKLPEKLIYLIFFVFRYLFVLQDEFKKLYNAMLLRGFTNKTSVHSYKSYAYLIGMLLVKSYDRSEKVYHAMLCRGFTGQFYLLDDFEMTRKDLLFLGSMTAFIGAVVFILYLG